MSISKIKFIGFFILFFNFSQISLSYSAIKDCEDPLVKQSNALQKVDYPRKINPAKTFDALVEWIHDEIVVKRKAPGLIVGISGTDSILTFLASYKAFEKAGRADRVAAIHFGPSEALLDENPAASAHLWFQTQIIPWLKKQAPQAEILVDTSVDFKRDGLRWGALMDWSVFKDPSTREMRALNEQYWTVGTRNATEEALFSYSSISRVASVQPLLHLWKSEVLKITQYLGVPEIAIDKSCEVDCICGRERLPSHNIPELDALIMQRQGLLSEDYVQKNIPIELRFFLNKYIDLKINEGSFKRQIPYLPNDSFVFSEPLMDLENVAQVKKLILEGSSNSKALSKLTPEIIENEAAPIASDLVSAIASSPNRENWMPEALVLFNTPGLRLSQKKQMLSSIFSTALPKLITAGELEGLSKLSARLGNYGFSFPQWRFLTQNYGNNQPALAEQFGMKSLVRENDIRDVSLEKSNPDRDELGRGFVWHDDHWYVEYRRAYIVVSNKTDQGSATLVIRNNSHFFGRDRLKKTVYFSLKNLSFDELEDLTVTDLDNSGEYYRWQDFLRAHSGISLEEKIKRTSRLLDYLGEFNKKQDSWFHSANGIEALLGFFEAKIKQAQAAKPPLFLGAITQDSPSWNMSTVPLTLELVAHLRQKKNLDEVLPHTTINTRFVMTSGPNGDMP